MFAFTLLSFHPLNSTVKRKLKFVATTLRGRPSFLLWTGLCGNMQSSRRVSEHGSRLYFDVEGVYTQDLFTDQFDSLGAVADRTLDGLLYWFSPRIINISRVGHI
jgi:hypothetical protein